MDSLHVVLQRLDRQLGLDKNSKYLVYHTVVSKKKDAVVLDLMTQVEAQYFALVA